METEFSGQQDDSEFSGQLLTGEFSGQNFVVREYPYIDERGDVWIDQVGIFETTPGYCFVCGCNTRRHDVILKRYFCNSVTCYYEMKAMELVNGSEQPAPARGRHARA